MTVYLKAIYVRISQMVRKYTKAISLKKTLFQWQMGEQRGFR